MDFQKAFDTVEFPVILESVQRVPQGAVTEGRIQKKSEIMEPERGYTLTK